MYKNLTSSEDFARRFGLFFCCSQLFFKNKKDAFTWTHLGPFTHLLKHQCKVLSVLFFACKKMYNKGPLSARSKVRKIGKNRKFFWNFHRMFSTIFQIVRATIYLSTFLCSTNFQNCFRRIFDYWCGLQLF